MTRRTGWKRDAARRAGIALMVAGCALLASCKKELYANLSEQDVNEMAVALLERGVSADK
ncbi:MAG: EscJ/YscJ/HrcJ family type III secretion inner membrane ring protein, partial [Burkholderia sp.]|nr:EscJ/YscJ/HrcJ family type III secretion inner membrane ring protein [Burkholderia sp.]